MRRMPSWQSFVVKNQTRSLLVPIEIVQCQVESIFYQLIKTKTIFVLLIASKCFFMSVRSASLSSGLKVPVLFVTGVSLMVSLSDIGTPTNAFHNSNPSIY